MKISWPNKHQAIYYEIEENGSSTFPVYIDYTELNIQLSHYFEVIQKYGIEHSPNRLICGDNLFSLQVLVNELELQKKSPYIQCVYIDPPYNTGFDFGQYDDQFDHSEWLGLMYFRLKLLKRLIKDTGFILVQLNDTEQPYLEILLDDIFGKENKIGTIIWRRRQSQANLIKTVSTIHDYILIYAKEKEKIIDNSLYSISGGLWVDTSKFGHNFMASKEIEAYFGDQTAFDTPKPELLIYHIIDKTTQKGEFILDCFAGSGTTLAVAQKMERNWIGIELIDSSCELIRKRLEKIINGEILTPVDELVQWFGGGGFRVEKLRKIKKNTQRSET